MQHRFKFPGLAACAKAVHRADSGTRSVDHLKREPESNRCSANASDLREIETALLKSKCTVPMNEDRMKVVDQTG